VATFELEHVLEGEARVASVLALAGELDLTNVAELDERVATVGPDHPLLLDLSRLVFVDSAALHRFFGVVRARGNGDTGFVVPPTTPVAGAVAIVQLRRVAPVAPSREEALDALLRRA
jgi:anti-anti-sigma factor